MENEDLIREFQGVKATKVNSYRFHIKDFVKSDFIEAASEPAANTPTQADPKDELF